MTLAGDTLSRLGPLADAADGVAGSLVEQDAVARLFAADHTLWRDDPTELADRLGWIPVVRDVLDQIGDLRTRCDRLAHGMDHVLVMGMGGSSLFPEVLARTLPTAPGHPAIQVLDTTDPTAIARIAAACPPERTVHLASSKSGSTIETRCHLEWAWVRAGGTSPFAVVTDPGSELGGIAHDRGFVDVFENRPDIGGRYSALSFFGVVPALLAGVDVEALLAGAAEGLAECGPDTDPAHNPALAMAAAMAAGATAGRDKLTFELSPEIATLGLWLEQLVAESLGKDGTGLVPIVGEQHGPVDAYGSDRLFVIDDRQAGRLDELASGGHPHLLVRAAADARSLGRLVVVSEAATALTGAALGVQPFDQPDVAAAKEATSEVLEQGIVEVPEISLTELLGQLRPGDHLALQAFVDPEGTDAAALARARTVLRDRHRVAVTLGYGPRFLHSTGQLHKGGPDAIVCVQVVSDDPVEIGIPGRDFGFGHLKWAQAAGDLRTLQARGIRAGRVPLDELRVVGA